MGSWGPMTGKAGSGNEPRKATFVEEHIFRLRAGLDNPLLYDPQLWEGGSHSTSRKESKHGQLWG